MLACMLCSQACCVCIMCVPEVMCTACYLASLVTPILGGGAWLQWHLKLPWMALRVCLKAPMLLLHVAVKVAQPQVPPSCPAAAPPPGPSTCAHLAACLSCARASRKFRAVVQLC